VRSVGMHAAPSYVCALAGVSCVMDSRMLQSFTQVLVCVSVCGVPLENAHLQADAASPAERRCRMCARAIPRLGATCRALCHCLAALPRPRHIRMG